MNERSFSMVLGYLPQTDNTYSVARKLNLNKRFAIALNSFRSSKDEMYFDSDMFLKILIAAIPLFHYDAIRVLFDSKKIERKNIENLSVADLLNPINPVEENDPFSRLEFLLNNKTICLVNPEIYATIGGPAPYHDTFTFSFYSDHYDRNELISRIKKVAETEDFHIESIKYGNELPEISLLTKLKRFFR